MSRPGWLSDEGTRRQGEGLRACLGRATTSVRGPEPIRGGIAPSLHKDPCGRLPRRRLRSRNMKLWAGAVAENGRPTFSPRNDRDARTVIAAHRTRE